MSERRDPQRHNSFASGGRRRVLTLAVTMVTLGGVPLAALVGGATPVAAATPAAAAPASLIPCVPVPIVGGCLPGTGGTSGGGTSGSCPLLPPLDTLCSILPTGTGGFTLPTGTSSATPTTLPNTETAQTVTITDPFGTIYSAAGGAIVQLSGPSGSGTPAVIDTTGPATIDSSGVITAVFDLADPSPAAPGSYTLTVSPTDPTGLTSALQTLGITSSLPLDTVPVTVTAVVPTALTLTASTPQLVVGQPLTLSGQLTEATGGKPLAARKVGIFTKPGNATKPWKLAVVTTDAAGAYSYTFKPTRSAAFIAGFAGEPATTTTSGHAFALSPVVISSVVPVLTLHAKAHSHHHHPTVTAKGRLRPAEPNAVVFLYRVSHGAKTVIGKATTNGSSFTIVSKRLKPGRYHLQVGIQARPGNLAAVSRTLTKSLR